MKKIIVLIMILVLTGCANQEDTLETNLAENQSTTQEENEEIQEEQVSEEEQEQEAYINEVVEVSIYIVDPDTGEIVQKQVESSHVDEQFLWGALQEANILSQEATLLSMVLTEEGIVLDVDANFGEYIRSMGTAGETEILRCVVWTYIDVFGVDKVKITEEGNILETGHQEMTEYMKKDN